MATRYLVVVYIVTAGLDENDLGSDEEEIVLFTWLVIDVTNCKVRTTNSSFFPTGQQINNNNNKQHNTSLGDFYLGSLKFDFH